MNLTLQIINSALDRKDETLLMGALCSKEAGLSNVKAQNGAWYLQNLLDERHAKSEVTMLILSYLSYQIP